MALAVNATLCTTCATDLAPAALACPTCHMLVHSRRLKVLIFDAAMFEREGGLTEALSNLRAARELLPEGSTQHRAITEKIRALGEALERGPKSKPQGNPLGGNAAGLGAFGLLLWKMKFVALSLLAKGKLLLSGLASLPTVLSMLGFVAVDARSGLGFAIGLVACIYVHEMGHVWALRQLGIKATAPMFIPGLGALVRLRQNPIDAREDARVGLAGPVWGSAAAFAAFLLGAALHHRGILMVASLGAGINLFNLIPFWQLDGARGFRALDMRQRSLVSLVALLIGAFGNVWLAYAISAVGFTRIKSDRPIQGNTRAFYSFLGLLLVLSALSILPDHILPPLPAPK